MRFGLALGRALYVNEIHGVDLKWDQFPPHRPIKENVHHLAHVPSALWGEIEGLNPFLNCKRLNLRERNISSMRLDVVLEPRTIPALCHTSLGNRFLVTRVTSAPPKVPAQEFSATFCEQLGTCSAGARINSSACHPYRKSHLPLADALRSYCCLLVPRRFSKSFVKNKKTGRGGGDRIPSRPWKRVTY